MKKSIPISLIIVGAVISPLPNFLINLIIGLACLCAFYDIGIKKNLELANLVLNSQNPSQWDKNMGKITAIISLLLALLFLGLSLYYFIIS